MLTAQELIETFEQSTKLTKEIDYNIMPGEQGVTVLTVGAVITLTDKFSDDALKEAENSEILKFVNGTGLTIDTSSS